MRPISFSTGLRSSIASGVLAAIAGLGGVLVVTLPVAARADVPSVVADLPPVHGLVAAVMAGRGEPTLLLPDDVDPHHHAFRSSEVLRLQRADIFVTQGEEMTPSLEPLLEDLPDGVVVVDLAELPGLELRPVSPEAPGAVPADEAHEHGDHDDDDHEHAGHDDEHSDHGDEHAEHDHKDADHEDEHAGHDHKHADHDDEHAGHGDEHAHHDEEHGDDKHHDHDEHAHDDHGHEGHAHHHAGDFDPHLWLDPENAVVFVEAIRVALTERDPDGAATYAANAEMAVAAIRGAQSLAALRLGPVAGKAFIVDHASTGYLSNRFGLGPMIALGSVDNVTPGAARVAEVGRTAEEVHCIFVDPAHPSPLAASIAEDRGLEIVEIDPLGRGIEPGPGHYPALLTALTETMALCLENAHR